MDTSVSKKKEKLDLSKLSAMELLLIGESQSLNSQPSSSKSIGGRSQQSSTRSSSNSEEDAETMDSEDEESTEDDSGGESDDWEEVSDRHVEAELKKYDKTQTNGESSQAGSQLSAIPEGGLEIVIPKEGVFRKRKKGIQIEDILRRQLNRERTELQEEMHRTSVLSQLGRGLRLNTAINSESLRAVIKERLKGQSFSAKRLDITKMERFIKWFRSSVIIAKPSIAANLDANRKNLSDEEFLAYQIMEKTSVDTNNAVLIFAAFLRYLKIDVRLVISVNAIPLKVPSEDLIKKPKEEDENEEASEKKSAKQKPKKETKKKTETKRKPKKTKATTTKSKQAKSNDKKKPSPRRKNTGRKMITSSEDEDDDEVDDTQETQQSPDKSKSKFKVGQDMWVEVFLPDEDCWASVDIITFKVFCDEDLEKGATHPLTYVLAFDSKNKIKDVTRRYASNWLTGCQKLRSDEDWWNTTLKPYQGKRTARDKEEDKFLDEHLKSMPMPKTLSEVKGHPLYVIRRHLLKYEAIYPESPPILDYINKEPVYARDNVYQLHTRELWMREAKVVRLGEKAYKIVKARPKFDRLSGARLPDEDSELFGIWQTEDYVPPIAKDGKVPRNEYGSVELYTLKLLPQGCVHLKLPGLPRVARKLNIDCAPATVGFEFGCGGSRPVHDGFVVCEEFKETLEDAWKEDQEEQKRKVEVKRLQRIYGNWRKLVRGVMIRARLEKKYSIDLSGKRKAEQSPSSSIASSSKKTRKK